ncbi:hypothetical protein WR25_24474 [Diploscapter pachys]|uniref:C2H2-type domain-containing protein n=1 Tax=Diploscapter pachys TaxID=2018661 RepID=A0A2A2KY04_9BILA|nr:hypothetical protein WR25_24474 [Diploscapter pachys]
MGPSKNLADMGLQEISEMDDFSPSSSDDLDGSGSSTGQLPDANGFLQCRFCPVKFENQPQLSLHYAQAHKDKPQYRCDTCHDVFAVKRELATHMRIHSGEEPHKCTQCGKDFGTRQLLKKHWMWHTGERSHICPICNKAFFQKGHLTQHLMIHSGGRPHKCKLCQKTFIFKFDLNRHMKIHAERGYSCNQCGRSFIRQLSLDEHALKCKGKSNSTIASSPSSVKSDPSTPTFPNLMAPGMFNFNRDQLTKIAQSLLNQQQSTQPINFLASSLPQASPLSVSPIVTLPSSVPTAPLPTPSPIPYFCMLCSKPFATNSMFTAHMYVTHLQNRVVLPQTSLNLPAELMQGIQEKKEDSPSLFTPIKPIRTDVEENVVVEQHSATATNSSCASSPHKSPPFGVSPSDHHTSTSPSPPIPSFTRMPQSPKDAIQTQSHQIGQISCGTCQNNQNRICQLESALLAKDCELMKYKEMTKMILNASTQILAQAAPQNPLFLHTKNIFAQMQDSL